MIRAIVFDVDDTLLDFGKCSKHALMQACTEQNVPYSDLLYDTFNARNAFFWQQIEKGELTLAELWRIRWNLIFEELSIDADGAAFESAFHGALDITHEKVEVAEDVLRALHPDYVLTAASNGRQHQQETRLRLAGLDTYLSDIVTSEMAGINKPDPAFFQLVFDRLKTVLPDLEKSEVLMGGDSLSSDIGGASSFGFQTWYVKEHPLAELTKKAL